MKQVVLLFVCVLPLIGYSQRYSFQTYSTAAGLPQSQITALIQDDQGYLWVGTLGGISRYNGNTFKNYTSNNGLLNNRVRAFSRIGSKLYIGHDGGISIMEGSRISHFSLGEELSTTRVSSILKFRGEIFVATNGYGLFKLTNNRLVKVQGLHNDQAYIRQLIVINDHLYLATRVGLFKTSDGKNFRAFLPEMKYSMIDLKWHNGSLFIATVNNGLWRYEFKKNDLFKYNLRSDDYTLSNVFIDTTNTIWISTTSGILKLRNGELEIVDINKGLPINLINLVYEDRDKNIWIGTETKGLVKAPNGDLCYFDKESGLLSDIIISGFEDKSGDYYFGTYDEGVVRKSRTEYAKIQFKYSNTVWSAQSDVLGKNWFGTRASLASIDRQGSISEYFEEDGTPGNKITCFHKVSPTKMYVGGSEGVNLFDNGKFIEIAQNRHSIGVARSMIVLQGVLYVATDMGLYYLVGKRFELVQGFNKTVFCLTKDENDVLFFGTEMGLFALENGRISQINYATELASNVINFLNYRKNELIIGTNNGIYILRGEHMVQEKSIVRVGLTDGLVDLETNLNSGFFDKKGLFWCGTASGLVRFNPNNYKDNRDDVRIELNEILLNYDQFNYERFGGVLNKNNIPENLILPYNKNNLQFNIDGISLSHYSNVNFQYWLEGLEDNWGIPTKNTSISYSGIPAGHYVLHARIIDIYGRSKDKMEIAFVVKPAFYMTWWFISFMAILVVALVLFWFQRRLKSVQIKNEIERVAFKARLVSLEQQSLNASMNRHFIFNSLNSIQYFINSSDKLSANRYLTNFAKLIRKNLDSSSEDDNMVTLEQELERIKLYLSLEAMRFKDKFEYSIETNDVDLENYTIPAMMIQPFVENSIIHGILPNSDKLGILQLVVDLKDDILDITITDNGIGIDESIAHKQQFDGDHKSQGMEITMKRIDLIRKVSDQNLELVGPLQINGSDGSVNGTTVSLKISVKNLE